MANIMNGYILNIVQMILLAIAAMIGMGVKKLYNKYVNTEVKKSVVRTVVRAVEQIYKDLHGSEKLEQAIARASHILEDEYGIDIGDYELISLIEAAVNEFNDTFRKDPDPPESESKAEPAE